MSHFSSAAQPLTPPVGIGNLSFPGYTTTYQNAVPESTYGRQHQQTAFLSTPGLISNFSAQNLPQPQLNSSVLTLPSSLPSAVKGVEETNWYLQGANSVSLPGSRSCMPASSKRQDRPVVENHNRVLDTEEVWYLFNTVNTFNSKEDFNFAEAGSVFMFKPESALHIEDWRRTGHIFRQNGGAVALSPRSSPGITIKKKVANIVTPSRKNGDPSFRRYSWSWEGRPHHILIQFIGDHSLSQPLVHANSRSSSARPRNPIMPSLAREVEASKEKPAAIYERLKMNAGITEEDQHFKVPSNKQQIKDLQKNFRRHLGRDDIQSILLRLSREYKNFQFYLVSPRVVLVLAEPEMVKYARTLLQTVGWKAGGCRQQVSYDTQFRIGDFYASMLTIRDVRMKHRLSGAIMILPVFLVLHDRKFKSDHELAFDVMNREIPELKSKHFLATCDQEFVWLLSKAFPKASVGICENHLTKSLSLWVDKNIGRAYTSSYKNELRTLIREPTRELYEEKVAARKLLWDNRFESYYEEYIEPLVDKCSVWKAREIKWGGMTPTCIWSSNQSESYNRLLRHKLQYQEVEMDECFHVFRDIQRAVLMETIRARLDLGDYHVMENFVSDFEKAKAEEMIPRVAGPSFAEISSRIKELSLLQFPRHNGVGLSSNSLNSDDIMENQSSNEQTNEKDEFENHLSDSLNLEEDYIKDLIVPERARADVTVGTLQQPITHMGRGVGVLDPLPMEDSGVLDPCPPPNNFQYGHSERKRSSERQSSRPSKRVQSSDAPTSTEPSSSTTWQQQIDHVESGVRILDKPLMDDGKFQQGHKERDQSFQRSKSQRPSFSSRQQPIAHVGRGVLEPPPMEDRRVLDLSKSQRPSPSIGQQPTTHERVFEPPPMEDCGVLDLSKSQRLSSSTRQQPTDHVGRGGGVLDPLPMEDSGVLDPCPPPSQFHYGRCDQEQLPERQTSLSPSSTARTRLLDKSNTDNIFCLLGDGEDMVNVSGVKALANKVPERKRVDVSEMNNDSGLKGVSIGSSGQENSQLSVFSSFGSSEGIFGLVQSRDDLERSSIKDCLSNLSQSRNNYLIDPCKSPFVIEDNIVPSPKQTNISVSLKSDMTVPPPGLMLPSNYSSNHNSKIDNDIENVRSEASNLSVNEDSQHSINELTGLTFSVDETGVINLEEENPRVTLSPYSMMSAPSAIIEKYKEEYALGNKIINNVQVNASLTPSTLSVKINSNDVSREVSSPGSLPDIDFVRIRGKKSSPDVVGVTKLVPTVELTNPGPGLYSKKMKNPSYMDMSYDSNLDQMECEAGNYNTQFDENKESETDRLSDEDEVTSNVSNCSLILSPPLIENQATPCVTPPPPYESESSSPDTYVQSDSQITPCITTPPFEPESLSPVPSSRTAMESPISRLYDPHPSIERIGSGVFRLPGLNRPIFVSPHINDCSVCGKKLRSNWCEHLVSAGLRLDPPIVVGKNAKIFHCSLSKLSKYQKLTKGKSGRKKPRVFDYQDINFNDTGEFNINPSQSSTISVSLFRKGPKGKLPNGEKIKHLEPVVEVILGEKKLQCIRCEKHFSSKHSGASYYRHSCRAPPQAFIKYPILDVGMETESATTD